MASKPKYTCRKYGGDDAYSWAVFNPQGLMVVNGENRRMAQYYRDKFNAAMELDAAKAKFDGLKP